MNQGVNTEILLAVLGGLHVFGWAYNWLVARLERERMTEGYTALLVVGGCLATLAGLAMVIGEWPALLAVTCFAASGAPMVLGSMWRHAHERRSARREMEEHARKILEMVD